MNPLDAFAKLVLNLYGVDTEALRQEQAADKRRAQNRKPINAKGQTSAFNKSGGVRNYQNTRQALTRPPTLDPLQTRGTQAATPPRRPLGGFGQAPGQLSIPEVTGGNNPNARPGGQFRAPSVGIPVQGAAGPDIPERPNPYRATGSTRPATGFTRKGVESNNPMSIGGIVSQLVNPFSTFNVLTGLATNLTRSSDPNTGNRPVTQEQIDAGDAFMRKHGLGKYSSNYTPVPQPAEYSGMQDMSGDPIRPTPAEVPMGRPDPFAPVDYTPPQQSYAPVPQAAPAAAPKPQVPSRKQAVNDAYEILRDQALAGEISNDEFLKQALKMHKDYFNKK